MTRLGETENSDVGPFHSVTEAVAADLREKGRAQLYPERGVNQCDVDGRRLRFTRLIGGGAFSDVFEVDYIPGPGFDLDRKEKVAVKVLKLENKDQEREVIDFVREIQIMRDLPERNYFVTYLGTGSLDSWNPGMVQKSLFIMMEYMNQGTLGDLLVKQMARPRKPLYTKEQALNWLIQIAHALNTLHSATPKILHRDVKAENILLTEDDCGETVAKLGDFGLHTCVAPIRPGSIRGVPVVPNRIIWGKDDVIPKDGREPECQIWLPRNLDYEDDVFSSTSEDSARRLTLPEIKYNLTTRVGSYMYMAPEVFLEESYSEKADVFSFGMMMYELLSARLMLVVYSKLIEERGNKLGVREYARRVSRGWRPSFKTRLPEEIKALITECWAPEASMRPSMQEVSQRLETFRSSRILDNCREIEERPFMGVGRVFTGMFESFWRSLIVSPCRRCFCGAVSVSAPFRQKLHRPKFEVKSV